MNLAVNFERKCRICGTDILDITCGIPIFGGLSLEQKIHKYLYIQVILDDELPKSICATCFIKIESIDKFASLASKTEETFRSWLRKGNKLISNCTKTEQITDSRVAINNTAYQNIRNPRHVDFITLEQIINDQIVKNPRIIFKQHEEKNILPKADLSVISYSDLKLGLLIKDQELLKLVLKALKWAEKDTKATYDILIQRLKNTSFRDILTNHNLLNDSDLMQLIKSYVGQDTLMNLNNNVINKVSITPIPPTIICNNNSVDSIETTSSTITAESSDFKLDDESITQMEVGVDPDLFLPYEDDDTSHKHEESITITKLSNEDKSFDSENESKSTKQQHYDTRNNARYICSACPEIFVTNTDLQEHVVSSHFLKTKRTRKKKNDNSLKLRRAEMAHTSASTAIVKRRRGRNDNKASKFMCTICKKRLSTKGNLKVHMETHKPKGKYTCDKCDRVFKTILNLMRHKQYHAGEQFSCDFCSRVYPTNSTLKAHMITHSDIRPHQCPLCEKTFKRNQDLKFHLNQHTGARPYTCPYCPKSFASSGNCFSHRKRMHSAQVERDKEKEHQNLSLMQKN